MNIFKNLLLFKKKSVIDNEANHRLFDQYGEIAKLVKEARIQKNITIQELSGISKIPQQTIISIENNNKSILNASIVFKNYKIIQIVDCTFINIDFLIKL